MSQNDQPSMPDITIPYDQFQLSGIAYWIESNGYKPHLLVNTKFPGVKLPPTSMVKDQEVINIHTKACGKFNWAEDRMEFNARFGGRDFHLIIPYRAILAMNFAHTGYWIPMPWTMMEHAEAGQAVEIPTTPPAGATSALDTVPEQDIVKPDEALIGKPSPLPDPVNGMDAGNVLDFSSRFARKKT